MHFLWFFFLLIFFMYIKTSKNVSGNIIKKIKKDYKKIAPERHLNLFKENKRKKWKYCCERYKNLLEDKKKKKIWVSIEKNITK